MPRHSSPSSPASGDLILGKGTYIRRMKPWNTGRSYVFGKRHIYANKGSWTLAMKRRFGDLCMRCGWQEATVDSHHIISKAAGGLFTLDNGVLLCPNCHRIAHAHRFSNTELQAIKDAVTPINPVITRIATC